MKKSLHKRPRVDALGATKKPLRIDTPADLHTKFKVACAKAQKPMVEVLILLMQEYVDKGDANV
jgi:hypothetical protein